MTFLIHFILATIGLFAIFLFFFWLGEEERTSMPFGLVLFGFADGLLAHYISPWITPVVLLLFMLLGTVDYIRQKDNLEE